MARADDTKELQPLLDQLAAGDASAADQLIEHSVQRLHRLARHLLKARYPHVRRWYETDDVVQAAAVRLSRALRAVRPASARDFLNLAAVQIRRELTDLARHEYGPEGPGGHHDSAAADPNADRQGEQGGRDHADPEVGPLTEVQWRDFLRHVQDALPSEEREVFDLLYVQDLGQEEAARLLGVSVPTVKRRWRSAKLLLYQVIHTETPRT